VNLLLDAVGRGAAQAHARIHAGFQRQHLEHRIGDLGLDFLHLCQRQIRDLIAGRRVNDTAFDRLVGGLADLFAKVGDHTLLHVAEKMRLEPSAWKPDRERRGQCVEEIAGHIICENLGHYAGIHELIDDLSATTPLETLKQILTLVAPSWVDVGAAGRLPLLASMPQRAAVINGSSVGEFTAEARPAVEQFPHDRFLQIGYFGNQLVQRIERRDARLGSGRRGG